MWIAVLIIVLAIAMMLGPIMLMQPSKRQRRLGQLRGAAIKQGLRVRTAPLPQKSASPGEMVTVYHRGWRGGKKRRQSWLLARQSFSHGVHFGGDWDWGDSREAPEASQDQLKEFLGKLPGSVVAVEATTDGVGLYWLEQAPGQSPEQAIEQLAHWLNELAGLEERPRGGQNRAIRGDDNSEK